MTEGPSDNLVSEIVRRVLDVLEPKGESSPNPGPAGRQASAPAGGAARPAGRVWLTAEMIADRAGGASAVTIALNEQLTPAARDYAAASRIEVCRDGSAGALRAEPVTAVSRGKVAPAALVRTLGLVASRPDAKVEAALAAATRAGLVTRGFAESSCWMVNARAMCQAIRAGELAGGLLIDRYAAAGMVLLAKVRGIRPVQAVSAGAVEAALRQFDANVLVIGHASLSVYEIRSMIDRFAAGRRTGRDRTALLDAVEQLEATREP